MTQASTGNYWISNTALSITLNALGESDRIQGSAASGAVIMCYIRGIDGLGYDNGHNYKRWNLSCSPTVFGDTSAKYVYVAIPRPTADSNISQDNAFVCFPSEVIDLYGQNADKTQVGSTNYYYINLGGIIASSIDATTGDKIDRIWSQTVNYGTLATDEAIAGGGADSWWQYSSVDNTIQFLKTISDATFNILRLSGGYLNKVATYLGLTDDDANAVVTTHYLHEREADIEEKYLRKDQDDTDDHKLTLNKLDTTGEVNLKDIVNAFAMLQSNGFVDSMSTGKGWGVDASGNMQVESLEVRSALRVLELVYNRLSAEESEYVFTESGTIESVEQSGSNYICTLKKRSDTDFHAFRKGDILRGIVNNLTNMGAGEYYMVWMQVVDINTAETTEGDATTHANTITVSMYADADVPSGKNYDIYPLAAPMVVQRWGNAVEPSEEAHNNDDYKSFIEQNSAGDWINRRQSCWYISSIEKRICMLDGVDKPKLSNSNYAAFFGLPTNFEKNSAGDWTFMDYTLNPLQPYLYCRGAFLQDIHYIDYNGQVMKMENPRGNWSAETAAGDTPYMNTDTYYDTVYYNNAKWQCSSSNTTEEPKEGSSAWVLLEEAVNGVQGYSIVASVARNSFTETNWNTYGTEGHSDSWSGTSESRNDCRIGDIFTIVGTATDTGNAHVLYYKSTTESGNLEGKCISHSISKAGNDGTQANLFGYDNKLECNGECVHTSNGIASILSFSSETAYLNIYKDANGGYWSNGDIISISCNVTAISVSGMPSSIGILLSVEGETLGGTNSASIASGETVSLSLKTKLTKDFRPYFCITGATGAVCRLVISNLKIENASNLNGVYTPYDGLAADSIPQGANLLLGTKDMSADINPTNVTDEGYQGCKAAYAESSSDDWINIIHQNVALKANTWYTLSFYAKASISGAGIGSQVALDDYSTSSKMIICDGETVQYYGTSSNPQYNHTLTTEWVLHTMTFRTYGAQSSALVRIYNANTAGNTAYISMPKLEEGAKRTDWQQSEDDRKGEQGIQGIQGEKGPDGKTYYTWVKYADDANGTNMSDYPSGKDYLGIAYNKTTATESTTASDYTWSKIVGEQGQQGPQGKNGETTYTWIKYADVASPSSSQMYDIPTDNTKYIGIAVNKTTETESTNPSDYTWSKFKGDKGDTGDKGPDGADGVQPNFFGYDSKIECNGTAVHTSTGCAAFLTVQSSGYVYLRLLKDANGSYWDSGDIISISCNVKVTNVSGMSDSIGMLLTAEGTTIYGSNNDTTLTSGSSVNVILKTKLTKSYLPYIRIAGTSGATCIVEVTNLKIEDASSLNGTYTPFNELATDTITQRPNLLLDSCFRNSSKWSTFAVTKRANLLQGITGCYWSGTMAANSDTDILQQDLSGKLKTDTWYTLSFWAKSSGDSCYIKTFIYSSVGSTTAVKVLDDAAEIGTGDNYFCYGDDSGEDVTVWKRHTVTFKTASSLPSSYHVLWRFKSVSSSSMTRTLYLCMPKLEECEKATDWQLNEEDRRGAALRGPSEWEAGKTYLSGSDGEEYQDMVTYPDYSNEIFLCKYTHKAIKGSTPGTDGNQPHANTTQRTSGWDYYHPWVVSDVQEFVATKVLFAKRATIDNLYVSELATGTTGTRTEISAGTFNIYGDNDTPGITVEVDESGCPHLVFYDSDGNKMYDLGPSGMSQFTAYESYFGTISGLTIQLTGDMATVKGLASVIAATAATYYKFVEGYVSTDSSRVYRVTNTNEPSTYNGRVYGNNNKTIPSEELRWYPASGTNGISGLYAKTSYTRVGTYNGNPIYQVVVYAYSQGLLQNQVTINFSSNSDGTVNIHRTGGQYAVATTDSSGSTITQSTGLMSCDQSHVK